MNVDFHYPKLSRPLELHPLRAAVTKRVQGFRLGLRKRLEHMLDYCRGQTPTQLEAQGFHRRFVNCRDNAAALLILQEYLERGDIRRLDVGPAGDIRFYTKEKTLWEIVAQLNKKHLGVTCLLEGRMIDHAPSQSPMVLPCEWQKGFQRSRSFPTLPQQKLCRFSRSFTGYWCNRFQ